jgi:1,4-dihydroxy-2-naphthoyl-CoA hydrolase
VTAPMVTRSDQPSAFLAASGLVPEAITANRVTARLLVGPVQHTPWGIVHGGVYATAVESAASLGATAAVAGRGEVAVGLTNTTHFLRSIARGELTVDAVALHQGRSQQLWQVDIRDDTGRLVARGELRLQNVAGMVRTV